jgi:hypothetical protein
MFAIESAKRRVMHLAEKRDSLGIGSRQRDARRRESRRRGFLLTSRFREGSTIDQGGAISVSPSVVVQ